MICFLTGFFWIRASRRYPDELIELLVKHDILFDHDEAELDIIKQHTVDFADINLYYPRRRKSSVKTVE
jgi:beta-glucosidase/6-phospho-beta-glucosidase/beta-galactosidase